VDDDQARYCLPNSTLRGLALVLVRLAHLTQDEMEAMVQQSYDAAPKKIKLRK